MIFTTSNTLICSLINLFLFYESSHTAILFNCITNIQKLCVWVCKYYYYIIIRKHVSPAIIIIILFLIFKNGNINKILASVKCTALPIHTR